MSQEQISQELFLRNDGTAFGTEKAVITALTKLGLNKEDYEIVPYEGGFAAKKISFNQVEEQIEDEVEPHSLTDREEKYYRVRFHAKSDPNQQDLVELSVNGETLVIEREKEVVIPERFVECARHAVHLQFKQLPNEPRKLIGKVMIFPFDVISEGSKTEYLHLKREGDKAIKKLLGEAS